MFQKQQTTNDLQKARKSYNVILAQEGKQLGLEETTQTDPVNASENDTHPIVESDTHDATVDTTVPKKCEPELCVKSFPSGHCL